MQFSGRLAAFPPSDILQWVHNDRRTGALVVRRGRRTKRVYFAGGNVIACFSDDPAEYYGQLLLLNGYIGHEELLTALEACSRRGIRLGVALLELGLMSAEEVQRTLRMHIEDAICDLFLWHNGVFYFDQGVPPSETLLPEPIATLRLAMEGARWIDELQRIRRVFIHDNIVLRHGVGYPGEDLQPLQQRIVDAVDARANLRDIYQRVNGSYFRFLEAAYQLAIAEILDIEQVGDEEARDLDASGVHNLLLEQAESESAAAAAHHGAVPLSVVERLFPLWIDLSDDGDASTASREFLHRCDGTRPLAQVLSAGPDASRRDLDTLLLCLREGKMALLPMPVGELPDVSPEERPGMRSWWRKLIGSS